MLVKTLVENTALTPDIIARHGLSFYIETGRHKLLFDLGPDDTILHNAAALGVDLSAVDTVVISHGHYDHGGALRHFLTVNDSARIYIRENAFEPHCADNGGERKNVGLVDRYGGNPRFVLTGRHLKIDDELLLFSGVYGTKAPSKSNDSLLMKRDGAFVQDDFSHEQSLLIFEHGRASLFAGCAHRGILNILDAAAAYSADISTVIGGFHLFNPSTGKPEPPELINEIADDLLRRSSRYYTCHCTGTEAFALLKGRLGDRLDYLSAGSVLK